ncbi:hypothetical protein AWB81_07100 [Caballeronia arationis]|uniref:S1 family peptidase n=1 Tax=Caballeronia arationis TaxID=1777142 RepID=UPI00074C8595|nr:serine protease [Caballeronia arationis]SAL05297.1 hypothetical protein AWB81_07100 [Caballeronia arationis]
MRHALMFLLTLVGCSSAIAQGSYQDAVAMVDASFSNGASSFGAGIVVSQTEQRTVIVTALHVVKLNTEIAPSIHVEFRPLRAKKFPATIDRSYIDPQLDLAVLFVDKSPTSTIPRVLYDFQIVSPSNGSTLAGAKVQVVGAMGRDRWVAGVASDQIVESDLMTLHIRTAEGRAGASGGAVFDTFGRILGMCDDVDSSTGLLVAIPAHVILNRLDQWGIQPRISYARAGSSSAELLTDVRKNIKLRMDFPNPPPPAPGRLWGEENTPGGSATFQQTIFADLSPGLAALRPTIEIHYTMPNAHEASFTLRPPDYKEVRVEYLVKLTGEMWVSLPDGRKLGPVPILLDFQAGPLHAAQNGGKAAEYSINAARKAADFVQKEASRVSVYRRDAQQQMREAQSQMRNQNVVVLEKQLEDNFNHWSIRCLLQKAGWACSYPIFGGMDIEYAIHSFALGSNADDLYENVPVVAIDELRPSVGIHAARVLAATRTASEQSGVYARLQLSNGVVLGPRLLCRYRSDRCDPSGW